MTHPAHPDIATQIDSLLATSAIETIDDLLATHGIPMGRRSHQEPPVYMPGTLSLAEFMMSPKFYGQVDTHRSFIDILNYASDEAIRQIDLILGKGSGKSAFCSAFIAYSAYKLLCMTNRYRWLGVVEGHPITLLNVSISEAQAKGVIFKNIRDCMERSDYFSKIADIQSNSVKLPENITIFSGHSNARSWLGFPTLVGVMDEVEHMVDTNNKSVARELDNALLGSMRTRFPRRWKMLRVSSVNTKHSFLYRRFSKLQETGVPLKVRTKKDFGPIQYERPTEVNEED